MKFSRYTLLILFFLGLLAPFIANERPLLVKSDRGWMFPVLSNDVTQWNQNILNKTVAYPLIVQPLIPWTAGRSDFMNADFAAPFEHQYYLDSNGKKLELPLRYHHYLGTDLRGTDLLSGLFNALRITFVIGISATFIAAIIAFLAGVLAAWYAADGLRISWFSISFCVLVFAVLFNFFRNYSFAPEIAIGYVKILLSMILIYFLMRHYFSRIRKHKVRLPLDTWMTRLNEVFSTFPRFILVIVIGGFLSPSVFQVIILLGLTGWPDLARVLRAEILRLREQTFIDAGRISGAGSIRILLRHLLPNAWPVLSVTLLYSLAMNILLEAGLGFLGMGIPDTYISLGGLMAQGKDHLEAWWIILFPGLLLSLTLFCIYRFAESMRPEYDQN